LGFRVVNSDEIVEVLLKASGLGLDMNRMTSEQIRQKDLIRDKAKALTDKRLQGYLQGRLGLVIDGTGKDYNKIAKQKANFESIGYDTFMIFVNTSLEVAQARNLLRDRKVPMELVHDAWHEVQQNIGKFNQLFGNRFVVIDNNKNISDEELFTNVFKKIMAFSKQAPDNVIAKKWIADYYKLR
jgi:predicted kinase